MIIFSVRWLEEAAQSFWPYKRYRLISSGSSEGSSVPLQGTAKNILPRFNLKLQQPFTFKVIPSKVHSISLRSFL